MGKYLQQQYEERELAKTLAKAHGIIDEETQKLSDKVKNLTLSHNRMRKLLKMCLIFIEHNHSGLDLNTIEEMVNLHKRITLELYGLENYKPIIKAPIVPKMDEPYELLEYIGLKGGKKCG